MLGIIGEYIWRIFDQVGKKPESVIEEFIRGFILLNFTKLCISLRKPKVV